MSPIDYFKSQAKHLHKDFETRVYIEDKKLYQYNPKYFDIEKIFNDFNISHQNKDFKFSLMNAQHTTAKLGGLKNWDELLKADEQECLLAQEKLNSSKYKLPSSKNANSVSEILSEKTKKLPAPENLYAWITPNGVLGINVSFSFDSVEYADSYMIYYSDENDVFTAKPLAGGKFSPINYVYRGNRQPAKFYWVRAFDGKEYGEWSAIAERNR